MPECLPADAMPETNFLSSISRAAQCCAHFNVLPKKICLFTTSEKFLPDLLTPVTQYHHDAARINW